MLRSEIDGQRPFIDALNASARELPGNARLAKKVEAKLKDINSRYEKVLDKSSRRGELLDEASEPTCFWQLHIQNLLDTLSS